MLENWRYNRALRASEKQAEHEAKDVFWEEEYRVQLALAHLGITGETIPSDVPKVGSMFMCPELVAGLRRPYAVEVLGMPHAGKTTMIERYLEELWLRKERNRVALVEEGSGAIKQEYKDLRETDPFMYSVLGGAATFTGYVEALKTINTGMRMVVSDRGQIDRRVFLYESDEILYNLIMSPSRTGKLFATLSDNLNIFIHTVQSKKSSLPATDKWTVKDILCHIVFWHTNYAENYRALATRQPPPLLDSPCYRLNMEGVSSFRKYPTKELIARLLKAQKSLENSILEKHVTRMTYKKNGRVYTTPQFLDMVARHVRTHTLHVRKAK